MWKSNEQKICRCTRLTFIVLEISIIQLFKNTFCLKDVISESKLFFSFTDDKELIQNWVSCINPFISQQIWLNNFKIDLNFSPISLPPSQWWGGYRYFHASIYLDFAAKPFSAIASTLLVIFWWVKKAHNLLRFCSL